MNANKTYVLIPMVLAALALAACGSKAPPTSEDPEVQAEIEQDAELKAKEEELARREAELALKEKEQDLARREAELAKATTKPAARPAARPATPAPAPAPKVAAGPKQYTVPAGTSIPWNCRPRSRPRPPGSATASRRT